LFGVEAKRGADAGGCTHRTEHGGRMKARLVHGFRHDQAEAAKDFGADGNPCQRHPAIGIVPLAGRQHRRHDHGTGMHRPALKRVIKILAMRGGAVDEGCTRRRQHA
jgi:hypothetical protein